MKMETEEIKFEFTEACRMIAKCLVADVKLYPNTSLRVIVNEYWDKLPYLKATRAKNILNLFRETDMGAMATLYAEVGIRDCIIDANSHDYHNIGISSENECRAKVKEFALELKDSTEFYKQMEELE
jgi:hypothetical protein